MPQLRWNEVEFLDFFAVEPIVEDYGGPISYELERNGMRLVITIWEYESVFQGSLFRNTADEAIITFSAYVRGEARFINDTRGRHLDFEDCIIAPSRFWYIRSGNPFDKDRFPISVTVRVAIDPDIQISFVDYENRT